MVAYTERDILRNKKFKYCRTFLTGAGSAAPRAVGLPWHLGSSAIIQPSPTWKYIAVIRPADKKEEEKEKYSIEIWDDGHMIKSIPTDNKHGFIYTDNWFGSVVWSADEKYLAYIAEKNPGKVASFFEIEKKDDVKPGGKFEFRDDWGETYDKKANPALFVASLVSDTVFTVEGVPENLSCGQVQWHPSGERLVFVGWPSDKRRLGIIHCFNRPSAIYSVPFVADEYETKLKEKDTKEKDKTDTKIPEEPTDKTLLITKKHQINRSPRYATNGRLIFLAADQFDSHNSASRLCELTVEGEERVVVEVKSEFSVGAEFPGLFTNFLPAQPFLYDRLIILETVWNSSNTLAAVNLDSGKVTRLSEGQSYTILEVVASIKEEQSAQLLYEVSSPSSTPQVFHGLLDASAVATGKPTTILGAALPLGANQAAIQAEVEGKIKWGFELVPIQDKQFPTVEAIFCQPTPAPSTGKVPLVLIPHGGPHVASTPLFSIIATMFLSQGYVVAYLNYRGSLGFGKSFVDSLAGHVGDKDVSDCIATVKFLQAKYSSLLDDRVFIYGGSHGGFLGGHLISRPELKVCAAALLNPVTNIAHNVGISDIRDWNLYEAGHKSLTTQSMGDMFEKSPIAKISSASAPALIILGAVDKRVPPSQGIELFYALKDLGVPTRALKYPTSAHALAEQEHESDFVINIFNWFTEHQNRFDTKPTESN